MTETGTHPWPLTPDGVTDWERVFEDPDTGFIQLIMQAHSPQVLKECATVTIQQLFIREDDDNNVMTLIIKLNKLLPDDADASDQDDMRDQVCELLRDIKNERIRKAAESLAKGEGERRFSDG